MPALQGLRRTLQLKQPRERQIQSTSGSPRPRRPANETLAGGEAPRRDSTALECASAKAAGPDEVDSMDARGGRPDWMERREANRPPRCNHLHLGGPVRAWQSGISLIQARTSSRLPARHRFTVKDDRVDDAEARIRDHASAMSHRNRMSRDHAAGRAGRRSTTPPVTSSNRDDAPRRE